MTIGTRGAWRFGRAPARLPRGAVLVGALLLAVACGSKRAPASPVTIVTQAASATQLGAGETTAPGGPTATAPIASGAGSSTPLAGETAAAGSSGTPRVGLAPSNGATPTRGGFAPGGLPVRTPSGQAGGCVDAVYQNLTPEQRVGQLFMVGLSSATPRSPATAAAITDAHAGNVVLYGTGWQGATTVKQTTDWLQSLASPDNTGGIGLFISGNQEGGQQGSLQAFYGAGFDAIPSALVQGQLSSATLRADATTWGAQLRAAGVNLNLAPVLDTVNQADAVANAPIGALQREYGFTPDAVAAAGVAFIQGMHDAGEAVAIKHFPGLGRVTGNTDFTASGIADNQTTADDAYLRPYWAGIDADAEFVMVSLASYTQIDPGLPAVFSPTVVRTILRSHFGGVIISDDMGAAAAVAAYKPAERALRFFGAGGDMVLTIEPSDIAQMMQAVLSAMQSDPKFGQTIAGSVRRVLTAKQRAGLLPTCARSEG